MAISDIHYSGNVLFSIKVEVYQFSGGSGQYPYGKLQTLPKPDVELAYLRKRIQHQVFRLYGPAIFL